MKKHSTLQRPHLQLFPNGIGHLRARELGAGRSGQGSIAVTEVMAQVCIAKTCNNFYSRDFGQVSESLHFRAVLKHPEEEEVLLRAKKCLLPLCLAASQSLWETPNEALGLLLLRICTLWHSARSGRLAKN